MYSKYSLERVVMNPHVRVRVKPVFHKKQKTNKQHSTYLYRSLQHHPCCHEMVVGFSHLLIHRKNSHHQMLVCQHHVQVQLGPLR